MFIFILTFGAYPHPALISCSFWALGGEGRGVFKDRETGERKSPREPLFHLQAARSLFFAKQWAHCAVPNNNKLSLAWLALGSDSSAKSRSRNLASPPRLQPSPHHSYPGVNQNIGLGSRVTAPSAQKLGALLLWLDWSPHFFTLIFVQPIPLLNQKYWGLAS